MASPTFKLCLLLLLLTISFCFSNGFTADLIHRDSPLSPLYNSSQSLSDRFHNAALRSLSRLNRFKSLPPIANSPTSGVETPLNFNNVEYVMNISLGNPPVNIVAVADTGSDLIWTQCKPCEKCYRQNYPIYDPSKSSTYRNLSCTSKPCKSLDYYTNGCDTQKHCTYVYAYADHSYTIGNLAADTLTLGSASGRPVVVPSVSFGCGHNNSGEFYAAISGIIGLGNGPLSLVAQLGPIAAGKFSYCLVPHGETKTTSKIKFGGDAVVSGDGVVSTPLFANLPDTSYYVSLEAISVADKNVTTFLKPNGGLKGNTIIDSGTTVSTILPTELFGGLVNALKRAIFGERTRDPSDTFSLCYRSRDGGKDLKIPNITMHLKGADVVLSPENTFVEIEKGVVCLAMIDWSIDLAILGNLSQINFLIGYDFEGKTISFKPTDCTKQ